MQNPYYNYYQRPAQPTLKGHQVASFDEAKSAMVDFDGTVSFYPDLANKRIYTKQILMDGTLAFKVYELTDVPIQMQNIPKEREEYITRKEFQDFVDTINNKMAERENAIQEKKEKIIPKF